MKSYNIEIITICIPDLRTVLWINYENKEQNYSLFMIIKTLDLPGYFLQNLDGVSMSIWILVAFMTLIPAYFGAGKILSKYI